MDGAAKRRLSLESREQLLAGGDSRGGRRAGKPRIACAIEAVGYWGISDAPSSKADRKESKP